MNSMAARSATAGWTVRLTSRPRDRCAPVTGENLDELIGRVAAGDRHAFERLYNTTSELVFGIARRVLVDSDLAAEVTQEVFIEIWRKASRFDGSRGSARTWIAVMAKRRAIDVVRSTQASRERDGAEVPVVVDPGDPVGDRVTDLEDRERIAGALGSLTDLQREALDLAFFGGLTHREVAERLDVPLGTVKTRIRDGLGRLASQMGAPDG